MRGRWRLAAALLTLAGGAEAQPAREVEETARGMLGLLGYAVVPETAAASLRLRQPDRKDPSVQLGQIGAGGRVRADGPLYAEGFLGLLRYDPQIVAGGAAVETTWTGVSATGGLGWDLPLTDRLVFRPILNLSLSYLTSDLGLPAVPLAGRDAGSFLRDGFLTAGGFGGSAMLDYAWRRPELETEVQLRWTRLRLATLDASVPELDVRTDVSTVSLWSRLRWPIGTEIAGAPLRWVAEGSHAEFLTWRGGPLGFQRLTQLGWGVEADLAGRGLGAAGVEVGRARLVGRALLGDSVRGFSLGFGVSF